MPLLRTFLSQGVVNKLSEANLEPLSTEICALYDTHSKAIVNTALSECLSTIAGTDTQVRLFTRCASRM